MKKMKKSMFFSSILMIVILVVALSTSTFAWFTSSATASVTETALYSASSSAANITVGWNTTTRLTEISFKSIEGATSGLNPMILKYNPYDEDVAFSDIVWHTAPAQIGEGGKQEFNSIPVGATPWTPEYAGEAPNPSGYSAGTFYVNNWNTVNDTDITITVTSLADPEYDPAAETGPESLDLTTAFRLAIWTKVGAVETFRGVYAPSGFAYFAETWAVGDAVSTVTTEANQIETVATFTGITVPKAVGSTAGSVAIIARAWFDGTELTDELASRSVTFTLQIQAVV